VTAIAGQLAFDIAVPVVLPDVELVDFAHREQLAGPRRDRKAATAEMRHLDDPAGAANPSRCACDKSIPFLDPETGDSRCFKCGRRP